MEENPQPSPEQIRERIALQQQNLIIIENRISRLLSMRQLIRKDIINLTKLL